MRQPLYTSVSVRLHDRQQESGKLRHLPLDPTDMPVLPHEAMSRFRLADDLLSFLHHIGKDDPYAFDFLHADFDVDRVGKGRRPAVGALMNGFYYTPFPLIPKVYYHILVYSLYRPVIRILSMASTAG